MSYCGIFAMLLAVPFLLVVAERGGFEFSLNLKIYFLYVFIKIIKQIFHDDPNENHVSQKTRKHAKV